MKLSYLYIVFISSITFKTTECQKVILCEDFESEYCLTSIDFLKSPQIYNIYTLLPKEKKPVNIYSNRTDTPYTLGTYFFNLVPSDQDNIRSNVFAGQVQEDTILWTKGYKLDYPDFQGPQKLSRSPGAAYDTLAISSCSIKYCIRIDSGKKKINSLAIFLKKKSWMIGKTPSVLKHEQGHFEITEIYAKRFQKIVNESNTSDTREFILLISSSYKQIGEECLKEQEKYDNWSMNTVGEQYYYKWIKEQLDTTFTSPDH